MILQVPFLALLPLAWANGSFIFFSSEIKALLSSISVVFNHVGWLVNEMADAFVKQVEDRKIHCTYFVNFVFSICMVTMLLYLLFQIFIGFLYYLVLFISLI